MTNTAPPIAPEDAVDLRDYVEVIRRRAAIILGGTAIGLAMALTISLLRTPVYVGRAEVLVQPPGGAAQGLRPSQLVSVETEARLVDSAVIAERAADALGVKVPVAELLDRVSVTTSPDTLVLTIAYGDPDPERAAAGANAFAEAYLAYKRESALADIAQQRSAVEAQIADLRQQEDEQARLLEDLTPGTARYRAVQDALNRLDVQITVLLSQLADLPSTVNPGEVILPATVPSAPASPRIALDVLVGSFLGLFVGLVAAFAWDRVDDRVRDRRDLAAYLPTEILTYIPHADHPSDGLIIEHDPRSPAAEAFRAARTTVMALAARDGARLLAVLSPLEREGKTTAAANLGAALGHADQRVVVVSADLRRPRIHEAFHVPNERGLADVLRGELPVEEAPLPSGTPNVWVLPAGRPPSRPAELLQSPRLREALERLRSTFDLVILDCPPVLGLADCLAIVPQVDAVLMVIAVDRSRRRAILEACDQIARVGGVLRGAFLNQIRRARTSRQHAYGYYAPPGEYLSPAARDGAAGAPREDDPSIAPPTTHPPDRVGPG